MVSTAQRKYSNKFVCLIVSSRTLGWSRGYPVGSSRATDTRAHVQDCDPGRGV